MTGMHVETDCNTDSQFAGHCKLADFSWTKFDQTYQEAFAELDLSWEDYSWNCRRLYSFIPVP